MLESYRDSQSEFYSMITSTIGVHNKISHAYLIDTSGFAEADELVLSFAKFLLCKNHYIDTSNCADCNLCSLIDHQADNHIQIISPDGLWIKKEQLAVLKEQLSKKSIDDFAQIYIIQEADKLNKSAANSLLKFLEEPEDGIIAILITNNRYKVLPTILSRCQIYTLKNNQSIIADDGYADLYDFIMNIERNQCQTICYIQDFWHSKYKTKEDFVDCFNKLEYIFIDLIHYKINGTTLFKNYQSDIDYIISKNTEAELTRKLSKILECRGQIQYNANLALLMDKFIIEYVGGE